MTAVTVTLPDDLSEWVQSRIAALGYASASDNVRDLIRRDQKPETRDERWLADLDASIQRGVADSDAGRVFDADSVFDELESKYAGVAAQPGAR